MEAGQRTKRWSEERQAERRTAPIGRIVYKAILKEGTEELERPSSALFWSGLAAGLSMGFSLIGGSQATRAKISSPAGLGSTLAANSDTSHPKCGSANAARIPQHRARC
jgi:hypothetical protein